MESLLQEIQKTYDNLESANKEKSAVIDEINNMLYSEDFSDTVKINYIKNLLKGYIKPF